MLSLQKKNFLIISLFIFSLSFTGCVSSKKLALRNTKTKIESKLGIEIGNRDDLDLFVECANWVGAPYTFGGTTKNGVDCSGFTTSVYRVVYDKSLVRSSSDI